MQFAADRTFAFEPPPPVPDAGAPGTITGAIATTAGEYIASGLVALAIDGPAWTATIARMDQPGVVACAYFARGVREVRLRLEDGRQARARIAGTTFIAGKERTCDLEGLEPLSRVRL